MSSDIERPTLKVQGKFHEHTSLNQELRKIRKDTNFGFDLRVNETIKYLKNPCYFLGYIDEEKKMKGTGNFKKCYTLLSGVFGGNNNTTCQGENCQKKNQTSVVLGDEFNDISTFLNVRNITLRDLKNQATNICGTPYDIISKNEKNLNQSVLNSLCFRLTYTSIVIEKVLENENALLIFPSSDMIEIEKKKRKRVSSRKQSH